MNSKKKDLDLSQERQQWLIDPYYINDKIELLKTPREKIAHLNQALLAMKRVHGDIERWSRDYQKILWCLRELDYWSTKKNSGVAGGVDSAHPGWSGFSINDLERFEFLKEEINGLPSDSEKIIKLKRAIIAEERDIPSSERLHESETSFNWMCKRLLLWHIENAKLDALEVKATKPPKQANPPLVVTAPEPEAAVDSTTAGRVMAVYYLLLAAGADKGVNKSEMGRLVCFLTGEKHGTIKRYWQKPLGNPDHSETKKNREMIRKIFKDLDLKAALDLMDRDE